MSFQFVSLTTWFSHGTFLGFDVRGLWSQNKYLPDNGVELHSHPNRNFRIFEPKVPNFSASSLDTRSLSPKTSLHNNHVFFCFPELAVYWPSLSSSINTWVIGIPWVVTCLFNLPPLQSRAFFVLATRTPTVSTCLTSECMHSRGLGVSPLWALCLSSWSHQPKEDPWAYSRVIKWPCQGVRQHHLLWPKTLRTLMILMILMILLPGQLPENQLS